MDLTDREYWVLELRRQGLTLATIGKRLGITRQRVWQIELSAKRKTLARVNTLECPYCGNIRPRVSHSHICVCPECSMEFIYDSRA